MTPHYLLRLRALLGHYRQRILLGLPACAAALTKIDASINEFGERDVLALTSMTRNWVNTNSVHLIDNEHDTYAFKVPEVICRLHRYSETKGTGSASPPHLSCGPRSYALLEILRAWGISGRIVDWFGVSGKKLNAHTMLEYFDPDLQQWILQDPDFNVRYTSPDTGKPLSAKSALFLGSGNIAYTSDDFPVENKTNLENTIAGMFSIGVLYRNSYAGERSVFYLWDDSMKSFEMADKRNFIDYVTIRGQGAIIRVGNG